MQMQLEVLMKQMSNLDKQQKSIRDTLPPRQTGVKSVAEKSGRSNMMGKPPKKLEQKSLSLERLLDKLNE